MSLIGGIDNAGDQCGWVSPTRRPREQGAAGMIIINDESDPSTAKFAQLHPELREWHLAPACQSGRCKGGEDGPVVFTRRGHRTKPRHTTPHDIDRWLVVRRCGLHPTRAVQDALAPDRQPDGHRSLQAHAAVQCKVGQRLSESQSLGARPPGCVRARGRVRHDGSPGHKARGRSRALRDEILPTCSAARVG